MVGISIRRIAVAVLLVVGCFYLASCGGGGGGDDVFRYDPGLPAQIANLQTISGVERVTLSWTSDPAATSYNVYYVSSLVSDTVTKENGIVINVATASRVIEGLDNDTEYHFMVTGLNHNGESDESSQASSTPGPLTDTDLEGSWYFHTLVTGSGAKWEKGTLDIAGGIASVSEFEDSAGNTALPPDFTISLQGSGELMVSDFGPGDWIDLHGTMGSTKTMMMATHSPDATSRGLTIFQRKMETPDFSIQDLTGTGSGQNPYDPTLLGNGPTRFAYHQLFSGANTEWEYSNAKIGSSGVSSWPDTLAWLPYKGITYWDYSTPTFKSYTFDFSWKNTVFGIDGTGLVSEYWSFEIVTDPVDIPSFNNLVPLMAHDTVFTGRMTPDKTMVIGVCTRTDANGNNPQYFMRIMQLCFKPWDQALPEPNLSDLTGSYKFHKIAAATPDSGHPGEASWSYGTMTVDAGGVTTFGEYTDSFGNTDYPESIDYPATLTFSYYPDWEINPRSKIYPDFANYTTAVQDSASEYYVGVAPIHTYYDYASWPAAIEDPATWREQTISPDYYNEHASLSYNRDMLVMTRTDPLGYTMLIGLK